MEFLVFNKRIAVNSSLLTSCGRAWRWLASARPVAAAGRKRRRQAVFAQAHGQTMLLDCQQHLGWWSGVVKIRDGSEDRVVHVCTELRRSADAALDDAEQDAQRLALMFAQ